jgi:hypothetical protein
MSGTRLEVETHIVHGAVTFLQNVEKCVHKAGFEVADDDLRYFDAEAGEWRLEACVYRFSVGFSSRDLPLTTWWRFTEGQWRAQ